MKDKTYKLDELARAAGTSPRTIRYYVQRGLLPAATFHGKDTSYDHGHLVRLRAIRRLQAAFLPLDAIAAELDGRTPAELERIAEGQGPAPLGSHAHAHAHAPPSAPAPAPASGRPKRRARASITPDARWTTRTWRRISLGDGLELALADDAPERSRMLFDRALDLLDALENETEGDER